jgi:uncharacterized protein
LKCALSPSGASQILRNSHRDSARKSWTPYKLRAVPDEPKLRALLLNALEDHYGSLDGCVVNPDRAVEALRNIQAELERVKDLL